MAFPVQNIREAAKLKGLTLAQIEKSLGIGNGVIAKWAKTKSAPPYDRIVAIAELLDVPVSQLTGDAPNLNLQLFAEKNPALDNENEPLTVDEIKKSFRGRSMSELMELLTSITDELNTLGKM